MNEQIQEIRYLVGEAWKGEYNSATSYGNANVVQDPTGLSVYRSLKPGNVGHPLTDANWWFCIINLSSIKAESDRIAALNQAIAQDEALRVAAEQLRQQKEAEREAAETQRNEAEQARINAEQQRVTKESQREANEQQRISAEQGRVTAESNRVTAEQSRVQAETLRDNAEEERVLAETNRAAAEQQRIANEQTRETQYAADHTRAEADHEIAVQDNAQMTALVERADADHVQAGEDHTRAESDHTTAASDHTQAGSDHTRAGQDHTQAGSDHTRAESDHTRAESDHAAVEVYVDSLGAFDISAYHATGGVLAKYADLTAALGTGGANIPDDLRKGGMSVKFVQSSDNNYVQFRCIANAFTTDINNWVQDVSKFEMREIEKSLNEEEHYILFELGNIGNDGGNLDSDVRQRSIGYLPINGEPTFSFSPTVEVAFRYYDSGYTYLGNSYTSNAAYVRFVVISATWNGIISVTINNVKTDYSTNKYTKNAIQKEVSELAFESNNLSYPFTQVNGELITLKQGLISGDNITASDEWIYTEEFIDISDVTAAFNINITPVYTIGARYYNANKQYLSNTWSSSAKYVRFIIHTYTAHIDKDVVIKLDDHDSVFKTLTAHKYEKVVNVSDNPIKYVAEFGGMKVIEMYCPSLDIEDITRIRTYRAYNSSNIYIVGYELYSGNPSTLAVDSKLYLSSEQEAINIINSGYFDTPQLKLLFKNSSGTFNAVVENLQPVISEHSPSIIKGITANEEILSYSIQETDKFIKSDGTVNTSKNYLYTRPVFVGKGDVVRVFTPSASTIAVIAEATNTENVFTPIIVGESNKRLYELTAVEDLFVSITIDKNIGYISICRNGVSQDTEETITLQFKQNCFLAGAGNINFTNSNYGISQLIPVYKGDICNLHIAANSGLTSVISRTDILGDNIITAVTANASEGDYQYIAEETGYIIISGALSPAPTLKITHGECLKNFKMLHDNVFAPTEFYRKKHFYVDSAKFIPENNKVVQVFNADTETLTNYIVNAVAYPNGEIIACRAGGSVVKIGLDGTETTLLTITGASDWRGMFIDSNNNVFVSPHNSVSGYGTLSMSDRGVYRLAYGDNQFTKVITLYNPSSSIATETQTNDDTIWTFCEDNKGYIYAGVYAHSKRANPAIYRSSDGGETWTYLYNFIDEGVIPQGMGNPMHIHCIIYNPFNAALYCLVGEVETVFKSVDNGETWVNLGIYTEDAKCTTLVAVPDGVLIGSDGNREGVISKLYSDDKTVKSVGKMWHAEFMAMRRSDVTGWIYAFSKIESGILDTTLYPPYSANTNVEDLNTWKNSASVKTLAYWNSYNEWVSKYYTHDAIHPCSAAIVMSRDNGESWEIVWSKDCGGYANGIFCTGYFLNGECLCGLTIGNNAHTFASPIVIKEGNIGYSQNGIDFTKMLFGKLI